MNAQVSVITLGVSDLERAKRFYGERLGCPIRFEQDKFGGRRVLPAIHAWSIGGVFVCNERAAAHWRERHPAGVARGPG